MAYSPSSDLRRYVIKNKIKKEYPLILFLKNLSAVKILIFLNILFFIIFSLLGTLSNDDCNKTFCRFIAVSPTGLFHFNYWWTLLTSMFMHAGFMHLFVNMISLFFIGNFLEMLIGKKRFFCFYLIAGIFAGLFYTLLAFLFGNGSFGASIFGASNGFALGASGAIFGIAGVLAVLTPRNKIYLIAGPLIAIILEFFLIGLFKLNSTVIGILEFFVFVYIFISFLTFLSPFGYNKIALPVKMSFWLLPIVAIIPLIILGIFFQLPIGNMAHLGGFIAGAIYGLYFRLKYKKKTKMIDYYFSR
jgi:membrane associated rhomboid family serine protease